MVTRPASTKPAESGNLLLQSLGERELGLLRPHLRPVAISTGDLIAPAGGTIETISFLDEGVASFADVSPEGRRTGIGIIGFEGLVEWPVLVGSDWSPYEVTIGVGSGIGLQMEAGQFLEACRRSEALHRHMIRFVQIFLVQLGQTAASNLVDAVEKRLCRWLLMNHDRMKNDEIELSHNQIGEMLGVRRASVTDALHLLEGERLIRCERRLIVVRDRAGLRRYGGEHYGRAEAEYGRLIGPFGKG
jgi:CRP-like cAMP-binding protein